MFGALADGTRRAMLADLAVGESTVSRLASPHAMSLPAASKHIRVLERAGLVSRTIEGRVHRLSLRPDRLRDAAEWIAFYRRFWDESLDRLDEVLASFDDGVGETTDTGNAVDTGASAGDAP